MTRDDEFIGQLEGYLDEYEGLTPLPDAVRQAVRAELPTTGQGGPRWGPMRYLSMSNNVKLGLAIAAVSGLALIGVGLLRPGLNIGNPTPTVTPRPSALPSVGPLPAGTYLMSDPRFTQVPYRFTVPDGWAITADGLVIKHQDENSEVGFASWEVTHLFGNACHWSGTLVAVTGTSLDSFAGSLVAQEEQQASGPIDTQLAGYPAKRIDLFEPAGFDFSACDGDEELVRLWADVGGDLNGGWRARPGQIDSAYIVDVDGKRIVIDTWQFPRTSAQDITEIEGIIASIRFVPEEGVPQ